MGSQIKAESEPFEMIVKTQYSEIFAKNYEPSIKLYKKKDGANVIKKLTVYFNDDLQSQTYKKSISRRVNLKSDRLVQIFAIYQNNQATICGQSLSVSIYFQHLDKNLYSQIQKKIGKSQYFQPSQIKEIALGLAEALNKIHELNYFLNRFNSKSVRFTQFNRIKIMDSLLSNQGQLPLLNKFSYWQEIEKGFLPPQQLECIRNERTQMSQRNPFKADIFAAGMVLLQACNLKFLSKLYKKNFTLPRQELDLLVESAVQKYNFADILWDMLRQDETDRPTAKQLLTIARTQLK